ncbi:MAG: DUF4124 domain-containing protein [Gammaproteobacteria bacterium]|nr:DUF4124 domain-containing protein [Gammaproteobacteria bacterium]
MKFALVLLMFIVMTAHAVVYRSTDRHGNVIFSDQPDDNAEQIELKKLPTYTPAPIPVTPDIIEPEQLLENVLPPKYQIKIVSPKQNESIWENAGNVGVNVELTPELNTERGDQLMLKLDGVQIGEPQVASSFTLTNIDRGSHVLVVSVVDKMGKVLRRSVSVLFHLHRRSVAQ